MLIPYIISRSQQLSDKINCDVRSVLANWMASLFSGQITLCLQLSDILLTILLCSILNRYYKVSNILVQLIQPYFLGLLTLIYHQGGAVLLQPLCWSTFLPLVEIKGIVLLHWGLKTCNNCQVHKEVKYSVWRVKGSPVYLTSWSGGGGGVRQWFWPANRFKWSLKPTWRVLCISYESSISIILHLSVNHLSK